MASLICFGAAKDHLLLCMQSTRPPPERIKDHLLLCADSCVADSCVGEYFESFMVEMLHSRVEMLARTGSVLAFVTFIWHSSVFVGRASRTSPPRRQAPSTCFRTCFTRARAGPPRRQAPSTLPQTPSTARKQSTSQSSHALFIYFIIFFNHQNF